MLKVLLILSVFSGGEWISLDHLALDTEDKPFTVETCLQAAGAFLGKVYDHADDLLDSDSPAVRAECVLGRVQK